MIQPKTIRLVAILGLSAVGGWLLGKWWFPAPELRADLGASPAPVGGRSLTSRPQPTPQQRIDALRELAEPSAQIAAVARWTEFNSIAEIRAMLAQLDALESTAATKFAQVLLLKQWIGLDPAGILGDKQLDRQRLGQIVLLWAEQDPDAAIAAVLRHSPTQALDSGILTHLFAQVSADDPGEALRLLEKHHLVDSRLYQPVFAALATENLQNAAALAASLAEIEDPKKLAGRGGAGRRGNALAAVATEWARRDGVAAIEWLRGLEDAGGPAVDHALKSVISSWSADDPQGFLDNLGKLPKLDDHARFAAAHAAATWWMSDPENALAWIDRSIDDPEFATQLRGSIVGYAAMNDPATAFEMAADLPPSRERLGVFATIARQTILTGPEATTQWLAGLEDPAEREAAARAAAGELAKRDPAAALEVFDSLAAHLDRPDHYHFGYELWDELIPHVLGKGSAEATGWLDTLPPMLKADALKVLAKNWAPENPQAAAEYIASQGQSDSQIRATQEVVRQWVGHEPLEAAQWVETLAEGQNRELAAKNVASHWTAIDPAAASDWIAGLPPSRSRDQAAGVFATGTVTIDPARALKMAESIADFESRRRTITETLQAWARIDPATARTAMNALQLPEREMETLRAATSL